MTPHTQSLDPPNCWQTTVACLLDVDPDVLPRQVSGPGLPTYATVLGEALARRGLRFVSVPIGTPLPEEARGWHAIGGMSERTARNGNLHMVVGRWGRVAWDPHPSRAGLLRALRWGLLLPR